MSPTTPLKLEIHIFTVGLLHLSPVVASNRDSNRLVFVSTHSALREDVKD